MQPSLGGKIKGAWNLVGMRSIDTLMKKTAPKWWYAYKRTSLLKAAEKELEAADFR
jgi:hypothetical protein